VDKPSAEAIAAFEGALPDDPRVVRRSMFGMPAALVNGHVFAGVFERGVSLRLGAARVSELEGTDGVFPFLPGGRRWPEYALADAERWSGTDELRGWVGEALAHTAGLPPKPAKAKAGSR
jgi:TfoX/Sxy family transcriptional regulator of competence genes